MAVMELRARVRAAPVWAPTAEIAPAARRAAAAAAAWVAKVARHPRPAAEVVVAQTLESLEILVWDRLAARVAGPLAAMVVTVLRWSLLTAATRADLAAAAAGPVMAQPDLKAAMARWVAER